MDSKNLAQRRIIILIFLLLSVAFIFSKRFFSHKNDKYNLTIAILQTISHPALDQVKEGFMQRMKEVLKDKISFIIQNPEGSTNQAQLIAQNLISNSNIDGFFAIATPALAVLSDIEKKRPVFFSAVTDPKSLGIVHEGTNVCGTSDMIDVDAEVKMLHNLLPLAKKVAILYNTSEINSKKLADKMKESLIVLGLEPLEVGFNSTFEITSAVNFACSKADVILAPTDNSIASTIDAIVKITKNNNKPLIVSDNLLVKYGALAAMGVNYKNLGIQAADIALKVLIKGAKPDSIPLKVSKIKDIFINKKALEDFGIKIPRSLMSKVRFVEQGN